MLITVSQSSIVCDLFNTTNIGKLYSDWSCKNGVVGSDSCTWSGINCGSGVWATTLDLANKKLTGTLPSSLGLWWSLENIYLSSNSLTGTILSTLGLLDMLIVQSLKENKLIGTVPLHLTGSSLISIDLSKNKLTGSLPSSLCTSSLKSLDVTGNSITCYDSCFLGNHTSAVLVEESSFVVCGGKA